MAFHRDFILQNTRRQPIPFIPEIELHLSDEVMPLWQKTGEAVGAAVPPPFWAFAWAGGQAIARYLLDGHEPIASMRVLDFATGSGLCAISAMKVGAESALAADVDPFCEAAVGLNADANGVVVSYTGRDLLDAPPPEVDLILSGDIYYEEPLAVRVLSWLRTAHERGIRVLIGDPGRAHLPTDGLAQLAEYEVPTTRELEDREIKLTRVFTFPP
jgi:predicted nicotinamide N-methyase